MSLMKVQEIWQELGEINMSLFPWIETKIAT